MQNRKSYRASFRSCQVRDYSICSKYNKFRFRFVGAVLCFLATWFDLTYHRYHVFFVDIHLFNFCEKIHVLPSGHHQPPRYDISQGNHRALLAGSTFHISDQRRWCAQRVSGGASVEGDVGLDGNLGHRRCFCFGCWIKNKVIRKNVLKGWKVRYIVVWVLPYSYNVFFWLDVVTGEYGKYVNLVNLSIASFCCPSAKLTNFNYCQFFMIYLCLAAIICLKICLACFNVVARCESFSQSFPHSE